MGVGTVSRPGGCFIMTSEISALDPRVRTRGRKQGEHQVNQESRVSTRSIPKLLYNLQTYDDNPRRKHGSADSTWPASTGSWVSSQP